MYSSESRRREVTEQMWYNGCNSSALRGVYSDTTQLNSTDPVEQRTAKSVMFLFMTSRPTNWVNWVTTFRTDRWQLFTLWTCRQLDVELSWVESRRYKRAFRQQSCLHNVTLHKRTGPPTTLGRCSPSSCFIWNANMYTRRDDPPERKFKITARPTRTVNLRRVIYYRRIYVLCVYLSFDRQGFIFRTRSDANFIYSSLPNWMPKYLTDMRSYWKT